MTVFCDTFALVAWVNVRDTAHQAVVDYFKQSTANVVVTEWVLVEFLDALSKPYFRHTAVQMVNALRIDSQFEIVGYSQTLCQSGFNLYATRQDKEWSFTDCISFALMTERGIIESLTADHHFEQAGFRAVFKSM